MLKMSRLFKLPMREALRAMEQLEQMAPPPAEEKPAFDFQAKKAVAKPKLDKAEITPMIEVTTEEIVWSLKGLCLMWSKK